MSISKYLVVETTTKTNPFCSPLSMIAQVSQHQRQSEDTPVITNIHSISLVLRCLLQWHQINLLNNSTRFNGFFQDNPSKPVLEVKMSNHLAARDDESDSDCSWNSCKAPVKSPPSPTTNLHSVFTGQKPFLTPNQQCHSTAGNIENILLE